MNKKAPVTVTIEPHLRAYAERLVETGKAPSISSVLNQALADHYARDKRAAAVWRAKVDQAATDPEIMARVERMKAHTDSQLARLARLGDDNAQQ